MKCKRLKIAGALMLAALMSSGTARGAGFALYETSARGNAMGGAMVGHCDDPSANYYNPASLTSVTGVQVMAGATAIMPSSKVKATTPRGTLAQKTEEVTFFVPHAYASWAATDRMALGLGVYAPYGLGSEYPQNWFGRYNSYQADIITMDINPNIAFKVLDNLSLAVGFQAMYFDLDLRRKLPNPLVAGGPDLDFKLQGNSWGYGFNAAAQWAVTKWASLGVVYRSEVEQSVGGNATVTRMGRIGATGDVTLPQSVAAGVNFMPTEKLNIGLQALWTGWSSYDALTVDLDQPLAGRSSISSEKDWNDVWRYSAGAEYWALDWMAVRGSYVYDMDPMPNKTADYLVPSNDRHILSAGFGFLIAKRVMLDVSYSYLWMHDRDVPGKPAEGVLPGSFVQGDAHMIAVSAGLKI